MSDPRDPSREGSFKLKERSESRRPQLYKVLLHNDDYTSQEWVVHVLQHFFRKNRAESVHLMLSVHHHGIATVAVYSKEIAETKVLQVTQASRDAGFPLMCTCEPE